MASVIKRVSRATGEIMWYGKIPDGKLPNGKTRWKMIPTHKASRKDAQRYVDGLEDQIKRGQDPTRAPLCSELFKTWEKSLTNRSADDDRYRLKRHVLPAFGHVKVTDVDLPSIMKWIDVQREQTPPPDHFKRTKRLSDATIRHNLNLLSRFFSWAIERGYVQYNPVRAIPQGKRPRQTSTAKDQPWIEDDTIVRKLHGLLPSPFDLGFLIGNQCGLRLGELCGLRLSDLDYLDHVEDGEASPILRVRFSYDGCLKEDKHNEGKVKWPPVPDDLVLLLKAWKTRREAEGAGPEDYVFTYHASREALAQRIEDEWNAAVEALKKRDGIELQTTFYQGTRHSFISRSLKRGVPLEEVSEAVGHASPTTTQRHYNHFVRRSWSRKLRAGLGIKTGGEGAAVVHIASHGAPHGAPIQSDAGT
jgi:integrase